MVMWVGWRPNGSLNSFQTADYLKESEQRTSQNWDKYIASITLKKASFMQSNWENLNLDQCIIVRENLNRIWLSMKSSRKILIRVLMLIFMKLFTTKFDLTWNECGLTRAGLKIIKKYTERSHPLPVMRHLCNKYCKRRPKLLNLRKTM